MFFMYALAVAKLSRLISRLYIYARKETVFFHILCAVYGTYTYIFNNDNNNKIHSCICIIIHYSSSFCDVYDDVCINKPDGFGHANSGWL